MSNQKDDDILTRTVRQRAPASNDDPLLPHPPTTSRAAGLVRAARPHQWVKNFACFAGVVFSGKLTQWDAISQATLAFVSFCFASSTVYLLNDVLDREADARSPAKRRRPIASGLVPVPLAIGSAVALLGCAIVAVVPLAPICRYLLGLYLLANVLYSGWLKHAVLIDVLIIAIGFVLRVLHGVYAVEVLPTPWIVLCMFFLALFLGFGKRRGELSQSEESAEMHDGLAHPQRPVLRSYRTPILDLLLAMTATMAIICYALYTVTGQQEDASLVISVPLVVYGVFRYLLLVVIREAGSVPEKDLLGDRPLLLTAALWVATCIAVIYGKPHFFG